MLCRNLTNLIVIMLNACAPPNGSTKYLWAFNGKFHICQTDTDQLFTNCLTDSDVISYNVEPGKDEL